MANKDYHVAYAVLLTSGVISLQRPAHHHLLTVILIFLTLSDLE